MIDLSHDNSDKRPERQPAIARRRRASRSPAATRSIVGVMIESFLVEGRQDIGDGTNLTYGQSVTDGCLGWEQTVEVLDGLAEAVRSRRARR